MHDIKAQNGRQLTMYVSTRSQGRQVRLATARWNLRVKPIGRVAKW